MNILVLINSAPKYKYFFARLAETFKKNGHIVYYAIDSKSSKYMEPIAEVDNISNTTYFSDFFEKNYSETFEILYPCTYGDFFYSDFDRFLTHQYNLNKDKHYWNQARLCLDHYFKELITQNSIDIVLYENISNSFAYSAWRIAELLGKRYIGIIGSRLPGRFEIHTSIIECEIARISSLVKDIVTEQEREWFEEYKRKIIDIQPDYMKNNALNSVSLTKLFRINRLKTLYRIIISSTKISDFYEYQRGTFWKKIFNNTYVNINRFLVSKQTKRFFHFQEDLDKLKEDFFVYPIHYHPESSTSVLAPLYTNEYTNIINIANNLQFGQFLYVKDHISAKGIQSRSFYKKISNLPNVRLIDSSINIKTLIKKSKGVITINSTAGYEALLLEKPVYLFGRVFYEQFPNVYRMSTFNDIAQIDSKKGFTREGVDAWYVAYKNYTFEGAIRLNSPETWDEEYFKMIYGNIMKRINEE